MEPCPICTGSAEKQNQGLAKYYDCERCGIFQLNVIALNLFQDIYTEIPKHLLSGFVRENYERNKIHIILPYDTNYVELIKLQLPSDNDVLEKARKLLLSIERRTEYPGKLIKLIYETDYPLAYSQNSRELDFYLRYLNDKRYVHQEMRDDSSWIGYITIDGWRAIESYKVPNAESDKVFVAMWYKEKMNDTYNNGIKKAIEDDCGYKSIRIDRTEYLGKVDDKIIAEIRESRFIVADFTGQRRGVYFEAGYAQGLGLKVIWTCHKDYVKGLHFDTRQENHITWEKPDDLREKLQNRIRAVIGLGPHKSK
jgi:hypothetical protein